MSGLGRTVVGVGAGFIAAQASIAGVQKIMSASIGAAMKFEHQMAQIRGLTGATKEDTNLLEGAIKDMAKTMPKSPAELGAGAYFVISAGITDAAEAADVLEISAKASAAGLGETRVVADAVTSALNAYKLEAGDAGKITDILTTTVRLGKTEAAALAGSIGRILPVAAAMGVSFEEVGANLAVMTKVGLSADEAATSLRATMTGLLNPTKEAEEALAAMGTSGEELRTQIREKGLLSALSTLMDKTGGNTAEIVKIIPEVRALVNVLGTVGSQAETYADTLDQMNQAQGATEKAFGEVADTAQFKMGVAMNELNLALMELGTVALPTIVQATELLSSTIGILSGDTETWKKETKEAGKELDHIIATQLLGKQAADALTSGIGKATDALGIFGGGTAEATGHVEGASDAIIAFKRDAGDMGSTMETEVRYQVTSSLDAIRTSADEARGALTDMFRETTKEELEAEASLASLRAEAGRLENKTGDLTAAEQERLDSLNDQIDAEEKAYKQLVLEKRAVEADAEAKTAAVKTLEEYTKEIERQAFAIKMLEAATTGLTTIGGFTVTMEQRRLLSGTAQHGAYIPPGVVTPIMVHGGRKGEVIQPLDKAPIAAGGRGDVHVHLEGIFAADHRTAMQLAEILVPEIRRALI